MIKHVSCYLRMCIYYMYTFIFNTQLWASLSSYIYPVHYFVYSNLSSCGLSFHWSAISIAASLYHYTSIPQHPPSIPQHPPASPSIPQHPPASPSTLPQHPPASPSIPQHPQHPPASPSIPQHPPASPSIPQHPPASPSIPQHPPATLCRSPGQSRVHHGIYVPSLCKHPTPCLRTHSVIYWSCSRMHQTDDSCLLNTPTICLISDLGCT